MSADRFVVSLLNMIGCFHVAYSIAYGFEDDKDFWIVDPIAKYDGSNVQIAFYGAGRHFIIDASINTQLYPHDDTTTPRCHYIGRIEGMKHSVVAISTCNNQFFGRIEWDKENFYIESANRATNGSTIEKKYNGAPHVLIREHAFFVQSETKMEVMNFSMNEIENFASHFVGLQNAECASELEIRINLVRDSFSTTDGNTLLGYVNTASSFFQSNFKRRLTLQVIDVKIAEECNDVFSVGTETDYEHFFKLSAFREINGAGDMMILFSGLYAGKKFGISQRNTFCNKFVKTPDGKRIRADAAVIYESPIQSNNAAALAQIIATLAGASFTNDGIMKNVFEDSQYPQFFSQDSIDQLDNLNLQCLCR